MKPSICERTKMISYTENGVTVQFEYQNDLQKRCLISNLSHCETLREVIEISTETHKMCTVQGEDIDWNEAEVRLELFREMGASISPLFRESLLIKVYPLLQRIADGERTEDLYYAIMSLEPYA